jgi:hypothetical protein
LPRCQTRDTHYALIHLNELPEMAKRKLSAAERLVDEQMLALPEWATEYPKRDAWHKSGNLDATKKAADLLEKRGLIEIWRETGLYRLKPKK